LIRKERNQRRIDDNGRKAAKGLNACAAACCHGIAVKTAGLSNESEGLPPSPPLPLDRIRQQFLATDKNEFLFTNRPWQRTNWGTHERGPSMIGIGPNAARDQVIAWSKDLARSIDYLETREDIDRNRIAYYGVSAGGEAGLILTALEPRLRASVLQAAGPVRLQAPPEIDFINFAPRIRIPTLLVYGRNDFNYPVEKFQAPLLGLLGTSPDHKRLATLAGGHTPTRWQDVIDEVLGWLDRYLGPVTPPKRAEPS
jgi:pimeloyl-ACP methyl ester carboxylesterase